MNSEVGDDGHPGDGGAFAKLHPGVLGLILGVFGFGFGLGLGGFRV